MSRKFDEQEIDRIIEMAWEDRTPFDAIELQWGIKEGEVIDLMRQHMRPSSFRMWRKRMEGRKTKHSQFASSDQTRHKSAMQRQITGNMISKR